MTSSWFFLSTINVQFEMLSFMADMDVRENILCSCVLPICRSCPYTHFCHIQQIPINFSEWEINWFQYVFLLQGINRRSVMEVYEHTLRWEMAHVARWLLSPSLANVTRGVATTTEVYAVGRTLGCE